jgi:hypothetical protein
MTSKPSILLYSLKKLELSKKIFKETPTFNLLNYFSFDINVYSIFGYDKIDIIYKLWEIVMLNKSLIILADSPDLCSEAIYGLMSILFPIPFKGKFFPYFTIFDQNFNLLRDNKDTEKNLLLGVTNPLFIKSFKTMEYTLRLDSEFHKELIKKNFILKNTNPKKFLIYQKNKPKIKSTDTLKPIMKEGNSREIHKINNNIVKRKMLELTFYFLEPFHLFFNKQSNVN